MASYGDLFGGLGGFAGALGGWLGQSDEDQRLLEQLYNEYRNLQTPIYNTGAVNPHDLQYAGDYVPETYDVAQPAPFQEVTEGPEGRAAQAQALDYFGQVGKEGLPLAERLAAEESINALSQENARQQEQLRTEMQRRGMAGGGGEMRARIAQGQASANLARDQGNDLARMAIENRINARSQQADIGGTMRSQDIAKSSANADMWNRFAMFMSDRMTQGRKDAADTRNAAQQQNLSEKQRLSDTNTVRRDDANVMNRNYGNQMQQQSYQDQLAKLEGQGGAATGLGRSIQAGNAANMDFASGLGYTVGATGGGLWDLRNARSAPRRSKYKLDGDTVYS